MASRTLPGVGLKGFWDLGEDGWKDEMDVNIRLISALLQGRALSKVAALPGSPADGDIHLLDETVGGGNANKVAIRDNGAWVTVAPQTGWRFYDVGASMFRFFNGAVWLAAVDNDTTLAGDSTTIPASQHAVKTFVTNAVVGLLDYKGATDCSANPNYPAALKGDTYMVSVAGKIGGAAGTAVDAGDAYIATADNAGGTQAAVGASWFALEHDGVFGAGVSLASIAETNAGTDTAKAITPDGLAGSIFGIETVTILVSDPAGSAITVGDGKVYFPVPSTLNGMNLIGVKAYLITASSVGIPTFQLANVTDAVDMLSTKLTIDATELTSATAAAAAVIDGTKDDVATGDILRLDCDVAGTGAKGLIFEMQFQLP